MGDQTSNNKPTEEMLVAHQWFGGRKRGLVLPAHAGMIPWITARPIVSLSAPRTCGDDPKTHGEVRAKEECSPHMRG